MTNIFRNKKILVAGGTGLVGQQLVPKLIKLGAKVFVVSLDDKSLANKKIEDFYSLDLMNLDNCIKVTKNKEIIFNLLGVTGSPKINIEKPASFMMSNIYCAINLLMAAQISKVKKYLYTSTYGVYAHSAKMKESDVWKTFPSDNDKFAGWAKRIGELQIEAFKIEYNFDSLHIVRPANIYGPYDNFGEESTVIASLIKKGYHNDIINVWGDGSPIRDFIYSKDVARGMLHMVENNINVPVNLGSGVEVKISDIANTIGKYFDKEVKYDKSKPNGDLRRQMNTNRAESVGFKSKYTLEQGLRETIKYYETIQ